MSTLKKFLLAALSFIMLIIIIYLSSFFCIVFKRNALLANSLKEHPSFVITQNDKYFGSYEIRSKELEIMLGIGRKPIHTDLLYSKCRPPVNDLGIDIGEEVCTRSWDKNGVKNVTIHIVFTRNGMAVIATVYPYKELIDIKQSMDYGEFVGLLQYLDDNL